MLGAKLQISVRRQTGQVETLNVKIPAGIDEGKNPPSRPRRSVGRRHPGRHSDHDPRRRIPGLRGRKTTSRSAPVTCRGRPGRQGRRAHASSTITLRVPPARQSGKKLRIKGTQRGPRVSANRATLFAHLEIVLPTTLDDESLELIEEALTPMRRASP